jgi:thioredoxin-related protein
MKRTVSAAFLAMLLVPSLWGANKVSWRTDFDKALLEAQQTSKPIFVDVYADWCEWCHKLDKEVYTDPAFIKYMSGYIPVKLNAEDNKGGTRVAGKYNVDGFPTLLVTDSYGVLTNRIGGFVDTKELIHELSSVQNLLDAEKKNPVDPTVNLKLGKEYLSREMYTEAETRFQKVLKTPDATMTQKEAAQFSLGLTRYYRRNLKGSLSSLETYYRTYTTWESREDALLLLSQVHIEMDSNEKAMEILKEFLAKYPNSGNTIRAQQVLSLIERDLTKSSH